MTASTPIALRDSKLLREDLFIGGEWLPGSNNVRRDIVNPATGEVIARVAIAEAEDVRKAIREAEIAFKIWAARTAIERAKLLRNWFNLILENVDDLAKILTSEQGKPLAEAKAEIIYGAGFIEWYAEEGKRVYGETIPTNVAGRRLLTIRQPIGVTAAITPWNFPMAMIARKAGPALAAGCSMVIKPASDTPLSALAMAELAQRAGIPAGVLNVVVGNPTIVAHEITSSSIVKALSFTGSTEVGKLLMAACATTVKKVAMELGGNAPVIVFDDADINLAIAGVMASKFRNSGQTCVCANRIFVQSKIYDEFVAQLQVSVLELKVGNGLETGITQGPLINENAVKKVLSHIEDAVAKGAKIVTGGSRGSQGGTFFEPTILTDIAQEMRIWDEETFGPVAAIVKFETENEVIELANDTPFGLAAYFFTQDLGKTWRVGERLEAGVIGINTGLISYEGAPFGGIKESGVGREGSMHGIDEFLEFKYLCIDGLAQKS
jgi:succinate-semialdehyde dehydrogenase/glutarate-semialdehyde dehydrogenase